MGFAGSYSAHSYSFRLLLSVAEGHCRGTSLRMGAVSCLMFVRCVCMMRFNLVHSFTVLPWWGRRYTYPC